MHERPYMGAVMEHALLIWPHGSGTSAEQAARGICE